MTPSLFDGPAPRVRATPASAAFLDVLADAAARALASDGDPFALADTLVLLPNRRATRGLVEAFARRLGGAALLPTIRPLGDLGEDVDVWGADSIALDVLPAIEPTRRHMELAALVRARDQAAGGVEDPVRALAMAEELAKLLDAAATCERVAWEKLRRLADEADLARHWAQSAAFLEIISTYWPERLRADGLADPGARGAMLLHALAREWEAKPPARPVIIAGSTGSVAATRTLMKVVSRLPRGVVVLPGLDVDLDERAWSAIDDQHPQHALRQTLSAIGVARAEVAILGGEEASGRARRLLMREALAPAEQTADWLTRIEEAGGADFIASGASGMSLIEAGSEDEEAAAIALLLREALETPGRTAALVTPDANLARRVEAKLARWGAEAVVSHGRPLRETAPGALVALLCELAVDPGEPVALAALLKHGLSQLVEDRAALVALEHETLRGARRHDSLADLKALAKSAAAKAIIARVEQALSPLVAAVAADEVTLTQFAEALTKAVENIAGYGAWSGADGECVWELLREAIAHGGELRPMAAFAASRVQLKLMEAKEAPHQSAGEARIALWGPLEARLQRRDLMILGGLNEGVWPTPAPEDPFLSRPMRAALGLPSLEQRIGLAAHDFAQLANAPRVVLTRALRRDGAPTLASRWLWRLQTLAKGAGRELSPEPAPLQWARALDAPSAPRAPRVPRPTPPAHARLKRISVTQVETLIRDPYALYARRILGLEALKPIGALLGAAERGTAIHAAIERFDDAGAAADLLTLLDEELSRAGAPAHRRVAERARLAASAEALCVWLRARGVRVVHRETKGVLALEGGAVLSGTADRIEIAAAGAAILDFKTGAPPSNAQVKSGLAPQLLLEAAMLAAGAFKGVPAARTDELIYWRFGGADPEPRKVILESDVMTAADAALKALEALLKQYAEPTRAFLSKPRVQFLKPYADYDLLARRKEWADAEGAE